MELLAVGFGGVLAAVVGAWAKYAFDRRAARLLDQGRDELNQRAYSGNQSQIVQAGRDVWIRSQAVDQSCGETDDA